ncbi:MAG: malto-oligosyltrehalose synthase, partial [Fibrobacter sp.]|nr:malto-oligosyltrehalose synthase [Fibrobacter sp.]
RMKNNDISRNLNSTASMLFRGAIYAVKNLQSESDPIEHCTQVSFAFDAIQQAVRIDSSILSHIKQTISLYDVSLYGEEAISRLDTLLQRQFYRLAYWKVAAEELNYRRFFTVSDLIAIRIEDEAVFDATHDYLFELFNKDLIDGFRIDHIDGLYNPHDYLNRLRQRAPTAYIVVEKILARNEEIPRNWPVQGTTGYDALNYVNSFLCDHKSQRKLDTTYRRFCRKEINYDDLILDKKRLIIGRHMAGDIDNIAHKLRRIVGSNIHGRDLTMYGLRRAIVEVMANFAVYRTYIQSDSGSVEDQKQLKNAMELARISIPQLKAEFNFLERIINKNRNVPSEWCDFLMRFQQFTGPLMAKGVEDTALYLYNRLISLNEVGGWPAIFGITTDDFMRFVKHRCEKWAFSINSSSTHDTKRGEDTRARINVISEIADMWRNSVSKWHKLNRAYISVHNGHISPSPNDEYLYYQTLVGTFPANGIADKIYIQRIRDFMIKAIREGKVHTAWIDPDNDYEQAVLNFVDNTLSSQSFLNSFGELLPFITWNGMLKSLSQLVIRMIMPGIPDIYQGSEFWDFSLVDPDNRRPVDFEKRTEAVEMICTTDLKKLMETPYDGQIKMYTMKTILDLRQKERELFEKGNFFRLHAYGTQKRSLCAFARIFQEKILLAIVPRFTASLVSPNTYPSGSQIWKDTYVCLDNLAGNYINIFTNSSVNLKHAAYIYELLDNFPVGVFINDFHQ